MIDPKLIAEKVRDLKLEQISNFAHVEYGMPLPLAKAASYMALGMASTELRLPLIMAYFSSFGELCIEAGLDKDKTRKALTFIIESACKRLRDIADQLKAIHEASNGPT